ncbi:hypothetical protein Tco_0482349 [Tanacetum coccineum]
MGFTSTSAKDCIHKSKFLSEGKLTDPQDLERNIHLTDMGLHSNTQLDDMGLPFISGSDHSVTNFEYQALMGATKEELKGFSDEEILNDGEDMDTDQPDAPEESSQPPPQTKDNWAKHEEVVASYVDLKVEIEGFHDEVTRNKTILIKPSGTS